MSRFFLALALAIAAPAANAQSADNWGRPVTCTGANPVTCTVAGMSVSDANLGAVMATINAMPPPQPPAPAVAPTTIATLAFMQRLTVGERQAIIVAARTSAAIQDWRDMVLAVAQVDVTDPLTIAGINSMAAVGLLTTARAAQILDLSKASP